MCYKLLNVPFIYRLSQIFLAPGAGFFLKKHFNSFFNGSKGLVLDVGCGPRLNTPLPQGMLFGLDNNYAYVDQYAKRPNQKGVVGACEAMPFSDNAFDESRCFGLLHHLPAATASLTVSEMIRCTRPAGRVIIIDNVWPRRPWSRPLAWLNRRCDRGRWIRHEEELFNLVSDVYPSKWQRCRFTYSFIGHEAVALMATKSP